MVNEILEEILVDARANEHLITGVIYPYHVMKKLRFDYKDIRELWTLVYDEMSYCLQEDNFNIFSKIYNRLSQFNDYIYLFLLLNRGGEFYVRN